MSLKLRVSEELKTSMKEKNTKKLSVLRVLKSEIERGEQTEDGKVELTDANIVGIVKKFIQGIKTTTNDQDEITILEAYLPQQLSEAAIRSIVSDKKAIGYTTIGEYMKYFKETYEGQYDGKILSSIIKLIL